MALRTVDDYEDGVFFHEATILLGQDPIMVSMRRFHDFLARTFPLDGLVLHCFIPSAQTLLGLYYIDHRQARFLGHTYPFTREQAMYLRAFSMTGGLNDITDSSQLDTPTLISATLNPLLEDKPRAQLVCCLKTAQGPLGLLRVMGKGVNCFSAEHKRRLTMLSLPLGFALVKVLREPEVCAALDGIHCSQHAGSEEEGLPPKLIGAGGGLREIMGTVRKLSGTEAPVLILGETGTGKELLADAVQAGSLRCDKPFIKVNCGAIPETLMDSTLFGHEKGAFTGAHNTTQGKFEQANGGTLFLDEVGELSLQAQVRLLRTLQNHVVERVGGTVSIPVDVRIIAATNRDLGRMLQEGTFREDLFHRLNVFSLHMPPLRERLQDLLPLARHFIDSITKRLRLPTVAGIEPASAERLMQYPWPGNVRELENLIERALILDYHDKLKLDTYLPRYTVPVRPIGQSGQFAYTQAAPFDLDARIREVVASCMKAELDAKTGYGRFASCHTQKQSSEASVRSLDTVIREHIRNALIRANGKIHGPGGAAEVLAIHPDTLRKRVHKLGLLKELRDNEQG